MKIVLLILTAYVLFGLWWLHKANRRPAIQVYTLQFYTTKPADGFVNL